MRRKITILLVISLLTWGLSGCERGGYILPYVPLELHLNIISEVGIPNQTDTLWTGGVNGLIIFREDYDLFHVYDRTCSQYPDHNEAVARVKGTTGLFECPECGSRFATFFEGNAVVGPASFPLHEYASQVDGDLLHIRN